MLLLPEKECYLAIVNTPFTHLVYLMAELKTTKTNASVRDFINAIPDVKRREECRTLAALMRRVTKAQPALWGSSIVGFGTYHYVYASGREGDWFLTGFSPRKQNLTLYIMAGFERYDELMRNLGKFKTGTSCLYIPSLEDIDMKVLERLIQQSVAHTRTTYASK